MEILTGCVLHVDNMLAYRGVMTEEKVSELSDDMIAKATESGLQIAGSPITVTHSITADGLEVEFLLPVIGDCSTFSHDEYYYVDELHVGNCVVAKYSGDGSDVSDAYMEINQYVMMNGLTPVTPLYPVTSNVDLSDPNHPIIEMDLCIGVEE